MWNRVKRVFKRRPKQKDQVITFTGGGINLEEVGRNMYKLEPEPIIEQGMRIVCINKGIVGGKRMFEVNGVMLDAEDILEAQRKYLRHKRMEDDEG